MFLVLSVASRLRRNPCGDKELYPWFQVWKCPCYRCFQHYMYLIFPQWHSGALFLTSAGGVFKRLIWSIVTVDLQFCSVFSQIHIQVASSKSKKLVPKESNLFIPDACWGMRSGKGKKTIWRTCFLPLSPHFTEKRKCLWRLTLPGGYFWLWGARMKLILEFSLKPYLMYMYTHVCKYYSGCILTGKAVCQCTCEYMSTWVQLLISGSRPFVALRPEPGALPRSLSLNFNSGMPSLCGSCTICLKFTEQGWAGFEEGGELLLILESYPIKIVLRNCFHTSQNTIMTLSVLFKNPK